jgi:acetoin utilization protein AcuC
MARRAAFVYDDLLTHHRLSDSHPLNAVRLRYTYELLESYRAFDAPNSVMVGPRQATEAELLGFHSADYLDAVRRLGYGDTSVDASAFNFAPGDNPAYEGMYEAGLWSTGASLVAAEMLISSEVDVTFSISGGLHHAMPGYAYGFCVFNDPVVAINRFLADGMRVAYVDVDCHHGDGVQLAYYDTDEVLTVSIHESGAFLFPGTGYTQETGAGRGKGYAVNVPLYPYTSDDVYHWAFDETVPRLIEAFRPDVLVTQLGIDSHVRDPITHLAVTVQGFSRTVRELAKIAPAKWLALGGGGYDLQAVARAWTAAYGVMIGQEFPDEVPGSYWEKHGVSTLSDTDVPLFAEQVTRETQTFAESSVSAVHRLVYPAYGISLA